MTLEEFGNKWKGDDRNSRLPQGIEANFGAVLGVLLAAGFKKEDIQELVGDLLDLYEHLDTAEGQVEMAAFLKSVGFNPPPGAN